MRGKSVSGMLVKGERREEGEEVLLIRGIKPKNILLAAEMWDLVGKTNRRSYDIAWRLKTVLYWLVFRTAGFK